MCCIPVNRSTTHAALRLVPQETLAANFEGTRTVLELAAAAGHLKGLVHVSSAFVNMNQPRSSIVDEQVYPLKFGSQVVDVEELARVSAGSRAALHDQDCRDTHSAEGVWLLQDEGARRGKHGRSMVNSRSENRADMSETVSWRPKGSYSRCIPAGTLLAASLHNRTNRVLFWHAHA